MNVRTNFQDSSNLGSNSASVEIPEKWTITGQCYDSFKNYLKFKGFTVYPTEFGCFPSDHPMVDIAAKMGEYFWAFEYKSKNDSISRGVDQLRCYSEWFDLVVLVSERLVSHDKSENYWRLKNMGAGLWNYTPSFKGRCIHKSDPVLQRPEVSNRKIVSRRFRALSRFRLLGLDDRSNQLKLCQFPSS